MLFYNAPMPAPNPRRVRIFLAEKGVEVPMTDVSIMTGGSAHTRVHRGQSVAAGAGVAAR